jgi:long-chain fatty acid transport protein
VVCPWDLLDERIFGEGGFQAEKWWLRDRLAAPAPGMSKWDKVKIKIGNSEPSNIFRRIITTLSEAVAMVRRSPARAKWLFLSLLAVAATAPPARAQYGLLFSGSGPVSRAMGGASTATAADAAGGLFWNPATISGLESSELDFGAEFLFPRTRLSSSIPAGALGPLGPPVTLSGSDKGDNGIFPLPSIGMAIRPDGTPLTFGLGMFEIGGFGVNYPASLTNPVLTPQPPVGFGLSSVYSQLQVFEIAPSVSWQVTDRLAVAAGPTADLASLKLDPAVIATPDVVAGRFLHYPIGTHTRYEWGVGVQAGLTYSPVDDWTVGASVKSPRWFEKFGFQSEDVFGRPRHFTFDADVPLVASAGVSYTGIERLLLETDFHYIDYANTNGFRQSGFDSTGAVRGIGWRSIWTVAVGARYQLTDRLAVMGGYTFNDNPIDDQRAFFNVASPTITEHTLGVGLTYKLTDSFSLSAAYGRAFQNSVTGPIVTPAGSIPGSSVTNTASGDTVVFGGTILFGGSRQCAACPAPAADACADTVR